MDNLYNHFTLLHSAPDEDNFSYTQKHIIVELRKNLPQAIQFNTGVRQGCILSPFLFNLYLNDMPFNLDNSNETDPITLPNGVPLNCLFYADDLVLVSTIASGPQKQINILQKYSEKWLLKINLKKTKTVIFQKQKSQINA